MIELYSSQAGLMEQGSLSNVLPVDVAVESEIDSNGGVVVSLSKLLWTLARRATLKVVWIFQPKVGGMYLAQKLIALRVKDLTTRLLDAMQESESFIVVLSLEDQFA
ncbi:hypothetical protein PIB30_065751 [Stylosanthes scabra]|uniref:Uncharacterized protein n=1 Tax=Stylosanthes scabra TaxID=79078 RepID=A0ABU6VL56_9FABA|nr:hypothetical protein [Stylosanthes scabra]